MFKVRDFESIRDEILNNISAKIDKREGTFTYDMISGVAVELAKAYMSMEDIINLAFIEDGFDTYLDRKVSEIGIYRKEGTKATGSANVSADSGVVISNGTILRAGDLDFVVLNDITVPQETEIFIEALEVGAKFNLLKGTRLSLVESINGVIEITVKSNLSNGTDIETDEELRDRYFTTVKKSYTSGNVAHYELWTQEVPGVGACKIYPLKNGNGTVEIVITDSNMLGASSELIESVKANIEEKRPIGANVSVVSATEKAINITANITLASGYSVEEVKSEFTNKVTEYLKDISFKSSYVSNARLGNLLLDTNGVFDYTEFKINNLSTNIALSDIEVPKLGTIEFEVM